jgi:polyhydroxybutyrate depolymerase
MLAKEGLAQLAAKHGYLFVAPDGRTNRRGVTSWSHQGSPAQNRDELAFIDAVLGDVRDRYPIADALPVFAGFSQGGSMVWDLACRRGGAYGDYVAVGGAFWEPLPAICVTPVGRLVHVHGLDDPVVPLEGRPIGDRWHQGDVFAGLDRFKRAAGCPQTPDRFEREAALHCRSWTTCDAGLLTLCLHDRGHEFRLAPLAAMLDSR